MTILLLTDMPPCTNYTAGIFLAHLVSMIPEKEVVCFSVLHPGLKPEIPAEIRIPIKIINKPREDWGQRKRVGFLASLIMETMNELIHIPRISRQVADFAHTHNVKAIWCILEGQTMIRLARKVAAATRLPLYTHIWDPPGWWMRAWKVNPVSAHAVLAEYKRAIKSSVRCGAASWAMAAEYQSAFQIECISLVAGLEKSIARPPAPKPSLADGVLHIGLAGQIYARDAWDAFMNALDVAGWRVNGYTVRIKILGQWLDPALQRPEVEFLGWRSQQETIELLSNLDILYCPYWFDQVFEQEARFSFPSKVTTYLASGRPVFFHGPEYSSPGRFLEENRAGVCCYSTDPADVVQKLTRLVEDEKYYGFITSNGYQTFMKKLSFDALRQNLYRFLPIKEGLETKDILHAQTSDRQ